MIRSRSNSRWCFASPCNRAASVSALADFASSLLRAFCRCFLVIVSGVAAGAGVDVDAVVVVCREPIFLTVSVTTPRIKRKNENYGYDGGS